MNHILRIPGEKQRGNFFFSGKSIEDGKISSKPWCEVEKLEVGARGPELQHHGRFW